MNPPGRGLKGSTVQGRVFSHRLGQPPGAQLEQISGFVRGIVFAETQHIGEG